VKCHDKCDLRKAVEYERRLVSRRTNINVTVAVCVCARLAIQPAFDASSFQYVRPSRLNQAALHYLSASLLWRSLIVSSSLLTCSMPPIRTNRARRLIKLVYATFPAAKL
jgi:hypothetical protein